MKPKHWDRVLKVFTEKLQDPRNAGRPRDEVAKDAREQVEMENLKREIKRLRKKEEKERRESEEDRRLVETTGITLEDARIYRQHWKPDGITLEEYMAEVRRIADLSRRGRQTSDSE